MMVDMPLNIETRPNLKPFNGVNKWLILKKIISIWLQYLKPFRINTQNHLIMSKQMAHLKTILPTKYSLTNYIYIYIYVCVCVWTGFCIK